MKIAIKIFFVLFIVAALVAGYFFGGTPPQPEKIIWGVNFSQKHASALGLHWQEAYLALLDELKVRHFKLSAHWDLAQPSEDEYRWEDLDWQIKQAEKRKSSLILVIGMKTGRWPECHIPEWAKGLPKEQQQKKILNFLEEIVLRYRNSPAVKYWQVENEPFFPFGECPWVDKEFVRQEVALVKNLDSWKKPVIIADSGEGSFWWTSAKIGDIVGTTLYKKVWVRQLGIYFTWPFNPTFYWKKSRLVKQLFGKDVVVVELQAEPWGPTLLYDSPLKEQEKSMNLERFRSMVDFARRTGLKEFYFWGGEWWFWMKEKQGRPEIWEEAKRFFVE